MYSPFFIVIVLNIIGGYTFILNTSILNLHKIFYTLFILRFLIRTIFIFESKATHKNFKFYFQAFLITNIFILEVKRTITYFLSSENGIVIYLFNAKFKVTVKDKLDDKQIDELGDKIIVLC